MTSIFLEMFFSSKILFVEQLLLQSFQILSILEFYLVKLGLNLDGSQSLAPQRYQKILLGCLLGYKTALNFICTSVEFQNLHHTSLAVM